MSKILEKLHMLQCTTNSLNYSWEGQNSSELWGCLSLHLEVIFHFPKTHLVSLFVAILLKVALWLSKCKKLFVQFSAHASSCKKKRTKTLQCKRQDIVVLMKKASAMYEPELSETDCVQHLTTQFGSYSSQYTIKDSKTNKCTPYLQKIFLWFHYHLQQRQCFRSREGWLIPTSCSAYCHKLPVLTASTSLRMKLMLLFSTNIIKSLARGLHNLLLFQSLNKGL